MIQAIKYKTMLANNVQISVKLVMFPLNVHYALMGIFKTLEMGLVNNA